MSTHAAYTCGTTRTTWHCVIQRMVKNGLAVTRAVTKPICKESSVFWNVQVLHT